ncbi:hypothetical protein IFM12275_24610 [Nocardia sputorum]|uniref:hypothetical protein n=1 Tax=Nocardia sputorum TaxID=2984338 RepID=UPI0024937288|nr:hypothetical protein [Nocardia sputorum]BDT92485.1 hypothetical protein IFM12275_24610 [Nocardia sputorum]
METEEVPVTSIIEGDVIKAPDSDDIWMKVGSVGQHIPQRREGSVPGNPDEFLTAHYFEGQWHRSDGTLIEGVGRFNYSDDTLVVRRVSE